MPSNTSNIHTVYLLGDSTIHFITWFYQNNNSLYLPSHQSIARFSTLRVGVGRDSSLLDGDCTCMGYLLL